MEFSYLAFLIDAKLPHLVKLKSIFFTIHILLRTFFVTNKCSLKFISYDSTTTLDKPYDEASFLLT